MDCSQLLVVLDSTQKKEKGCFHFYLRYHEHMLSMIILCLSACTDYNLYGDEKATEGDPLLPILRYEPESIDAGRICTAGNAEVWLHNDGAATLVIDALEIDGDGWLLPEDPTPIEIAASGSYGLSLTTGIGAADLLIRSNDPDRELSSIALLAEEDHPPTITITNPLNGTIVTEETEFTAVVSDDMDSPEHLLTQWRSNQDGIFSTLSPNADGSLFAEWNSSHTPGYHSIQAMVSDSCQNTTYEVLNICQQMSYDVENFDISTWHFEGAANWDSVNEWVELTPVALDVVGTAFSTAQIVSGDQVAIEFLFYIGDGTGADGISLTALDTDRMTGFLGGTGCGIGYGGDAPCTAGPALPGWSLEVDTWYNAGQDPTEADHLMFTFDGDVDAPQIWVELPEMEDNGWHQMRVQINDPHVFVEIDGVTYIDHDLSGYFAFPAYIGFTAGTGGSTNQHLIDSLVVTEQLCQE